MSNQFLMPNHVFTKTNCLKDSMIEVIKMGKKALIVTDTCMVKFNYIHQLTSLLDEYKIEYSVFDKVNFEPTDEIIYEGVNCFLSNNCEFLIALGGGSPIDAMKAIALVSASNQTIQQLSVNNFDGKLANMVAIATTSGTGSETTKFTIISCIETSVKYLIKSNSLMPKIAVIDPIFTQSLPANITSFTGIDALCHAIESYTSKKSQPLSEVFALDAIKKIYENLYICYNEKTTNSREMMSLASFEAGVEVSARTTNTQP